MDQGDNGAFNTHWVNRVFAISDFIKSGRKIKWIFRIFQNLNFTDKVSKLGWNIYLNKYIVCTWVEVHFVFCQIKYHPGRRCAQLSESYFKQFLFQGYSKIKWKNLLFCFFNAFVIYTFMERLFLLVLIFILPARKSTRNVFWYPFRI